jgi:hypothetical protein
VPYEVNFTTEFGEWLETLTVDQQEDIAARVQLLEDFGPTLGGPTVD